MVDPGSPVSGRLSDDYPGSSTLVRMSRRTVPFGLALAMLVPACTGASVEETGPTTTVSVTATTTAATTTSSSRETPTTPARQGAPEFTLQLGDGGSFTLSEGTKPVYLVFWAEW